MAGWRHSALASYAGIIYANSIAGFPEYRASPASQQPGKPRSTRRLYAPIIKKRRYDDEERYAHMHISL